MNTRWLALLTLASAAAAWACGPDFPNTLLSSPDRAVLTAPAAEFGREIAALVKAPAKKLPSVTGDGAEAATLKADLGDLDAALKARKAPTAERKRLGDALAAFRAALTAGQAAAVPAGLPPEFSEYLAGAVAWRGGKVEDARAAWQRVLALKESERRFRSTWAAFMLGKSFLQERKEATRRFQETRDLAARGFVDSLGLALTSLGWEGRAELNAGRNAAAAALYLEQAAHEDPTALPSLQRFASEVILQDEDALRTAAREPLVQRVVTAWLVSRTTMTLGTTGTQPNGTVESWLKAVEAAGVATVPGAERLAWLAYRYGWTAAAERWLAKAPADSAITLWLRAKLLLREGKLDAAAELLSKVVAAFPPLEVWTYDYVDWPSFGVDGYGLAPGKKALGELGVLRLTRREFTQALDALARSDFWGDAAYVAERVLTTDELRTYVDGHWPKTPPEPRDGQEAKPEDATARNLRALLGRRLVREGRHADAERYLPKAERRQVAELGRHLVAAQDAKQSVEARAFELWRAAKITRVSGLEIMGAELAPDWASYGGQFELDDVAAVRAKPNEKWVLNPTDEEVGRAQKTRTTPFKRFHYRYVAAGLAWQAAASLPETSEAAVGMLCQAGKWLAARDPKEASRFYKAMVKRSLKLGGSRSLAWFPADCKAPK